jgi:hypothetical protein
VSRWLDSLPHQIPFRAASRGTVIDDGAIEGDFLATACDALTESSSYPVAFLVEAMAQLGGGLAFRGTENQALLSAIDGASIDEPLVPGERLRLVVNLEASFGGIFRFRGVAFREGLEVGRARFYLAAGGPS